jgi:dihydropteroate synthase
MPPSDHDTFGSRFPGRARQWMLRTRTLEFGTRPLWMGIVNVTPDSFSDGGRFFDPQQAVQQGLRLIEQGADLLDVGGESTRPYAEVVPPEEELRRVIPVVRQLAAQSKVPISIDTSKASVARAALDAGAEIINDVTGLEGDPAMLPLALSSGAGVCAMHMQGTPQTMQDDPVYDDVVSEVIAYLKARRDGLQQAGVAPRRIVLDPGIGFGKTHQHNLELLRSAARFHSLGCPLLFGHSRKGFIAKVLNDKQADPAAGSLGVALALACQGIQIIRIHEVGPARDALLLFEAAGGWDTALD